jgi:hypothetical protein
MDSSDQPQENWDGDMDWTSADSGDPSIDQMSRQEMLDYLGLEENDNTRELSDDDLRDAVRERASGYAMEESENVENDIDEAGKQIATSFQFKPEQFDFLRSHGVKVSMSGDELFFPELLVLQLTDNATSSPVKQEFKEITPTGDMYIASMLLTGLKKVLGNQGVVYINSQKYYVLKGHMTSNGNFNFPNPYRS